MQPCSGACPCWGWLCTYKQWRICTFTVPAVNVHHAAPDWKEVIEMNFSFQPYSEAKLRIDSISLSIMAELGGRKGSAGREGGGVSCQNLGCKKIAPPSIRLPVTQSWLIVCREETCCSEPRLAWGKMSLPLSSQCTQTYRHLITAGGIRSRHGGDALCGVLNWLMESVHVGEDDDQRLLLIQVKRQKERQRFQLLSALCAFLSYQWRVIDFFSRFFFLFFQFLFVLCYYDTA